MKEKKSKSVIIMMNNEFILIESILRGVVSISDPYQNFVFLPKDTACEILGGVIREKLSLSRVLDFSEFQTILNSDAKKKLNENLEARMIELHGYKNRKEIYKNMRYLMIDFYELDNKYKIQPMHQDSLDGYSTIYKDNSPLVFEYYNLTLDEDLGRATIDGFQHCTSIYKK